MRTLSYSVRGREPAAVASCRRPMAADSPADLEAKCLSIGLEWTQDLMTSVTEMVNLLFPTDD